ncbi:MAG TPA: ABC transporter permease [Anaerolineae bacterium]|nr:ABC transporter permease [Anaerolineae bacterium]
MATTLQPRSSTLEHAPLAPTRETSAPNLWARLRKIQPTFLALLGGIVIWEVAGQLAHFSFLPPFSAVINATWRMTLSGEIPSNLVVSLVALVIGYLCAIVVGVPLGVLMGRYSTLEYLIDPYINAMLATPSLLYVPILFGIFGISRVTQVAVIFLYSVIIITIMTMSGIRTVEASYVEMARAFGANDRQMFRQVLLPAAMPTIIAGLRLGMGRAVRGMINGEMIIVLVGLGALLRNYGGRFDSASVFGILIVIVAVAVTCNSLLKVIERRVTRWTE